MSDLRTRILSEIQRYAEANRGKPPGKAAFARRTGIGEHQWSGVLWARWSDALIEAGYSPNALQQRFNNDAVLTKIIEVCKQYRRLPTVAELKLARLEDQNFPSKGALANHFPTRSALVSALACRAAQTADNELLLLLPQAPAQKVTENSVVRAASDGFVYLLRSGEHCKIGRSDNLERRIREIRVSLPETAVLAHVIRTDDPSGIERYWHGRFADRRANGEWFKLTPADVSAFKRRKFQ